MLSASAPWSCSNSLRPKMVGLSTSLVNASALIIGFFPARDRKRIVTSTVSLGLDGPISRAPSNGARSLPASGRRSFGADIDLLPVGRAGLKRNRAALPGSLFAELHPTKTVPSAILRVAAGPVRWLESSSRPATTQDVCCACYEKRTARRISRLAHLLLEYLLLAIQHHLVEGVGQRFAAGVGAGAIGARLDSGLREL
jgi:hypothetical protein